MKEKRHNYEYDVDTTSTTAPANVVRLVGKNKRVLELGCGPGSITKILATESQCCVTGMELDSEAISKVTPYCENIFKADLNTSEWPTLLPKGELYDVIVAADVLEHLYDPWSALKKTVQFLKPDGYIVISLPHVGHAAVMSCLIDGDFEYRDWGLLDRTHIRFFGLKNIQDLFVRSGLKIIDVRYVSKPPEETEFSEKWSKLSSATKGALLQTPHANIYQVVIKAVPREREGLELSLIPDNLVTNGSTSISLKSRISRKLSPESKRLIRKFLEAAGIRV